MVGPFVGKLTKVELYVDESESIVEAKGIALASLAAACPVLNVAVRSVRRWIAAGSPNEEW